MPTSERKLAPIWRAVVETGFIMFLFYSNLLMGEYTRSGHSYGRPLASALRDVLTAENLAIGLVSALIGYVVVEFLRRRL